MGFFAFLKIILKITIARLDFAGDFLDLALCL
jgi:hypothetical protein